MSVPNLVTPLDARSIAEDDSDLERTKPTIQDILDPGYWHRWAVGSSDDGHFLRAAEFFRYAIVLAPSDALLRFDLGIALIKAKRLEIAKRAFVEVCRLRPSWDEPRTILRELRNQPGDQQHAAMGRHYQPAGTTAKTLEPHRVTAAEEPQWVAKTGFASLFSPDTDFHDDILACQDFVAAAERLWPQHQTNAMLLHVASAHRESPAMLVAIARRIAGVSCQNEKIARDWMTIRDGREAKRLALFAMRLRPDFETYCTAAQVLQALGGHEHAVVVAERCLHARPNDPKAMFILGELQIESGNIDRGQQQLRRSIEVSPACGRARFALASITGSTIAADEISELQTLADDASIPPPERTLMLYTIARRQEELGHFGQAFATYQRASDRKKRGLLATNPNPENFLDRVYATMSQYGRDFFQSRCNCGLPTERPVFIVGLPRSGTTLTEQILSSHPDVFGAGELHDLSIIGRNIAASSPGSIRRSGNKLPFPPGLERLSPSDIRGIAKRHLSALKMMDRSSRYVVDKMPTNFQLLGLISILFPHAKIIHCKRNLLDTCVSCFRNNFSWPFFELDAMADYMDGYRMLMRHWQSVLSLDVFEMRYEETVADAKGQTRKLLQFLDLAWSDDCQSYYDTPRSVRTPSRAQVRQPIYATSIGSWRRFQQHLDALVERFPDEATYWRDD
ncbi:Sulfotransferase domain protein [Rubripirellula lacrimiformis]|uniref:Sulfotransferase domain protein n=1 Tax=Rubripirellula lacrimiformis TaxID=1930273 RepID=A0A517NJF6_9BACT|nr:sulfotransferase [Rubripirellula lacrimiformis]QDT07269.1 Sulfotransferase domain protein [Rubripirellula lacrimiformis]